MAKTTQLLEGAVIRGAQKPGYDRVLTAEAIAFVADLERKFGPERRRLLAHRAEIQRRLDSGWKPDFLPETKAIRESDWRVAPIPLDIRDRRIEITGPTDRKMVINALNCGANVSDPLAHRVDEVHLPLDQIVPARRRRILEIGHVEFLTLPAYDLITADAA